MDRRVLLGVLAAIVLVLGAWIAHDPSSDVVTTAWRALPANGGWVTVEVPRWQPWRRTMTRRAGSADVLTVQLAADAIARCGVAADTPFKWRGVLHLDGSPDITVDGLDDDLTGCVRNALGLMPWAEDLPEGHVLGLAWSGALAEVGSPWDRCHAPGATRDTPAVRAGSALPAGDWRFDVTAGQVTALSAWPPTVSAPSGVDAATLLMDAPAQGDWRCFVRVEAT